MKNLLIATTALVATAGIAAAEVEVSGNGRLGVVYDGTDLNFSSRIRVAFTLSGETDGGLTFGGTFGAHDAGLAATGARGSVFVAGAFGTLAMGDMVGAAEEIVGDLPEIGYQDISGGGNDITYITGDQLVTVANNPVVLYTYSTGDLTFALSFSDGKLGSVDDTQEYAVGLGYSFGGYSVGIAYEVSDPVAGTSARQLILGGTATFGTTSVKAFYGDGSGAAAGNSHYGLGVTSSFDALTVKGYVKREDFGGVDTTYYGIGADYSLGGGATLSGGIADDDTPGSDARADFGITFSF